MGDIPATAAEVEAHLRTRDPDRWLSARLIADPATRREVLALYAFDDAVRAVAPAVTQPMLGEMRYAWWAEAVDDLAAGRPARGHPVLQAIAAPLTAGRLKAAFLHRLIEARRTDLDEEPPQGETLEAFLDGAFVAPLQAAAQLLDPAAEACDLSGAGRAWGLASSARKGSPTAEAITSAVAEALTAAKSSVASLPVAAFPAVAHVTLARLYAKGRTPGELERRARILAASALGRL
ncbi:phytoene/squalene synthase family protein [soil metagenome]